MLKDAALVVVSCVLFIQMGLSSAVQEVLKVRLSLLSCPKCLTMWTAMAVLLAHGHGLLESTAVSFLSAYSALWLALLYDALAVAYNKLYEQISKTTGSAEDTAPAQGPEPQAGGADALP